MQLRKDAIKKFKNDSDIKNFLDNLVFFNNYSFNNHLLIWFQNPRARYVASKTTYNKLGYDVLKDNNEGIKIVIPKFYTIVKITDKDKNTIYKPYYYLTEEEKVAYKNKDDDSVIFYKQKLSGFNVGNVFSAIDTDMPIDAIEEKLCPSFSNEETQNLITPLIKTIYSDGFKVDFQETDENTKGYCDFNNNTIIIKKGLGSFMQLKVLIHEYAHSLAHKHLKDNYKEYKEHRNKYETEAEAISYVVSRYLGIKKDDPHLAYLYSWSKEKDFQEIDDSLNTIVNYSKKIINNFEKFYTLEYEKKI